MRMILRLLMMFGPMLFRMYKKFQKKQAIQAEQTSHMDHTPDSQGTTEYEEKQTEPEREYNQKDFV